MIIGLFLPDVTAGFEQKVTMLTQPGHEESLIRIGGPSHDQQMSVIWHEAIHGTGHLIARTAVQEKPTKALVEGLGQPASASIL